jgi:triosephosphate isomerase
MRTPFIAGNWKAHLTLAEALTLASDVRRLTARFRAVEVAVIPPFPYIASLKERLEGSSVQLGGQDCYEKDFGAFTSAVGAPMLASVGCRYVLCGHSERRRVFGDSDGTVNAKVHRALAAGLSPILCIGETKDERKSGETQGVLERQLRLGLASVEAGSMSSVVVAYEPVWAIGTGDTASPAQAQDAHRFVRDVVSRLYGAAVADALRIQYGGSVKADNVDALMACPDIDGALVGGASLVAEDFSRIVGFRAP